MKHYYYIAVSLLFLLLRPCDLSAQRDVETILHGNSYEKIKAIYGRPLKYREFEYDGDFIEVFYPDFYAVIYDDGEIDAISVVSDKICFLSSFVDGGIKVGDHITKYRDVDFTKIVTGKHYEDNGLVELEEVFLSYPSDKIFNYGILSRGRPFRLRFAVVNGIIEEIFLDYLEDYTFEERADIVFSAQE